MPSPAALCLFLSSLVFSSLLFSKRKIVFVKCTEGEQWTRTMRDLTRKETMKKWRENHPNKKPEKEAKSSKTKFHLCLLSSFNTFHSFSYHHFAVEQTWHEHSSSLTGTSIFSPIFIFNLNNSSFHIQISHLSINSLPTLNRQLLNPKQNW